MKLHRNARTTPVTRALLVRRVCEQGWLVRQDAAVASGISQRTVASGWPGIAPRAIRALKTGRRHRIGSRGGDRPSSWPESWPRDRSD